MVSKTTTILKYKAYYRTNRRSFRLCLAVTFIFFILPISTSLSNIYYCDPIKGNTITGDGSAGNPWGTLQSIMEAGKFNGSVIKSGDIVKLETGFHGHFGNKFGDYTFNQVNTSDITIEANDNAVPDLNFIGLSGCQHWSFKGLRISPSFSNQVYSNRYLTNENRYAIIDFYHSCRYITIEDCNIFTIEDASIWSPQDWNDYAYNATRSGPQDWIVRHNLFKNIRNCLLVTRQDTLIEDNNIIGFSYDAIDIAGGPNITIQDNRICDSYTDGDESTHPDFIQGEPGLTDAQASNWVIRRNYCNARTDINRSHESLGTEGIQGFYIDKMRDGVIENNVLLSTAHNWGISINSDSTNVKIINNTVIKPPGSLPNPTYKPAIYFPNSAYWSGCPGHINTIVRNNISYAFPPDSAHTPSPYYLQNYRYVKVDYNFDMDNYSPSFEFADYINGILQLSDLSHFVNTGSNTACPSDDLEGNSRPYQKKCDAGAYEYVIKPPTANAGDNQVVTDLDLDGNEPVILDGSGSTAYRGSIISYTWTEYKNGNKVWEEVNSIPTLNKTLPVGKHSVTLTVEDDKNQTSTDSIEIIVMGLFGYYKFNECSGTLAGDSVGISTAGQLVNGPTWTAQGEIAFDGNNDAVEITTDNLYVNSGTIALWAYAEGFSKRRHFLFGETMPYWNNRIQLYCNELGMLCMGLGNNPDDIQILNLNSNEWYHIALVWDGMIYVVYVDGVQEATGSYSGLSSLQTYADIGNNGNSASRKEGFDGLIDDVRLYNRSLDANEIMGMALAFLPIDDKTVAEGESLSFTIRAKSDVLTEISDENLPGVPSLVSNIFSWTSNYDDAGTYQVTFSSPHISDGNYEDYETINISVLDTQQFEPIGHWTFDETSGNIAYDISTSSNNGSLLNGLVREEGIINGAIAFSVPNDAIEIQTTRFNTNSGTIAMWVYVDKYTLSSHYLFGHADTTDTALKNRIQLYLQYGTLCLGLGDSHNTAINIERLQIHQWYHITIIWNWGNYKVYVNGLPAVSGSYSGLTGFAANAEIGNNGINYNRAFNGKIDDVYIYNRALTAPEIAQLANN